MPITPGCQMVKIKLFNNEWCKTKRTGSRFREIISIFAIVRNKEKAGVLECMKCHILII